MAIRDFYDWDSTIFDGVIVPAGLDRELVINQIMMDCGLMDSYYSQPHLFKMAVTQWFATHQWNFEHLIKVVEATYSPIENTDRYSEHIIGRNRNENENISGQHSEEVGRETHKDTTDNLENSVNVTGNTSTETKVSAFNSSEYQPDTSTNGENQSDTTGKTEETITENGNDTENSSGNNSSQREGTTDETESYNEHTHGNIGVTTNQQMINEELALMKSFNIYQFISNMFMNDFCIMVW